MSMESIDCLLDKVYKRVGSYDPNKIVKAYHYRVIYRNIGPETLGTRICNSRRTTIILDNNLSNNEQRLVLLHEIKHCLTDQGIGTPFLRKNNPAGSPIAKREAEANAFAMKTMMRYYQYDLSNLSKSQICDYFGLDYYWSQFI